MILTYLNQTVEIKIPATRKRLKKSIIDQLFEKYDDYDIPIYKNDDFLLDMHKCEVISENVEIINVKTIGMWLSGGADSSLLAWLLCKKIKEEKLDIKFQPLSVRRGRPWNPMYAGDVLDFIKTDLNVDFILPHIIYYPPLEDTELTEFNIFRQKDYENFKDRIFDILYSGITLNPPKDSGVSLNKERGRDDDGSEKDIDTRSGLGHYLNPFFSINKKWEAEVYKDFGLLDTLFPLTRSCEGTEKDSGNYTYHCGKCWWCEERMWAFGRLV